MKNFQLTPLRHYYQPQLWQQWLQQHWLRMVLVGLVVHTLLSKDISFQVSMGNPVVGVEQAGTPPQNVAQVATASDKKKGTTTTKKWKDRKANTFSNLTFVLSPDYGERHGLDPAIARQKIKNCKDYVAKYQAVAIAEREKYGIPAAITLAQGLLESNAGDSRLSVESNNHFGIKCRTKCRGCTCRNYVDDDVYDMFRVFNSVWESYREHSKLLQNKRYRWLKKYAVTDYQSWAHGLRKSGYATDKRYAPKLIKIIEELNLGRFDR